MNVSPTSRARWILRLSLAGLVVALLVALALAWPRSSPLTPEEAKARYLELPVGTPRAAWEAALGRPSQVKESAGQTRLDWEIARETFTESVVVYISAEVNQQGLVTSRYQIQLSAHGWDAWKWRWARWW